MSTAPRSGAARRDWGNDDSQTPILHVDMDSFFAEVELLHNPQWRGLPVIVGGISNRGVVTSATYPARAYGVRAGMPIHQAKRQCPQGVFVPNRREEYSQISAQVMAILQSFTPIMEVVSIDEAFLDVEGSRRLLGSPQAIAQALRQRIYRELGLPASVGIATNKLIAKIASSHAKPDGVLLIPAQRGLDFLKILPVGALPGVGGKTREILQNDGIELIGHLWERSRPALTRLLGAAAGYQLYELSRGRDNRQVQPHRVEKSLGAEATFSQDIQSRQTLEEVLLDQSHQSAWRLRQTKMRAQVVAIKMRSHDFATITRSLTLSAPTDLAADIYQGAKQLLSREKIPRGGVRLLGVRVERLSDSSQGYQGRLDEDPRREATQAALDNVRRRFGMSALTPAALLPHSGRVDGDQRRPQADRQVYK